MIGDVLVGGLGHDWIIFPYFSKHIGNVIIPIDERTHIFQRGRVQPPAR